MCIRVSLCGMLRLIRVDTLRRVHTVGFLAGRFIYILLSTLLEGTSWSANGQRRPFTVRRRNKMLISDPQVSYIKSEGFGGVMVWALDLDDFSGSCGQGKYPLMRSIIEEINDPASGSGYVQTIYIDNSMLQQAIVALYLTLRCVSIFQRSE